MGLAIAGAAALSGCDKAELQSGGSHPSGGGGTQTARATTKKTSSTPKPSELPGGGRTLFPDRRFIALYGTPGTGALGPLGEQDLKDAVDRVKKMVKKYEPFSDEPVQPAHEVIATVASSQAGPRGDYSNVTDPDDLKDWIDEAGKAGVYTVLDLQPGRTDFLSQAKIYRELLEQPHVGLALDPEWRLRPGQVHGRQIGSVSAKEVNQVISWLADLTANRNLPQKLLILHQFQTRMIRHRTKIDTSHKELALAVHADGNGARQVKLDTWKALKNDLPNHIWMSWKNFYKEDRPTFTEKETYELKPKPWFVSYQ